jgi:hypothetical protein
MLRAQPKSAGQVMENSGSPSGKINFAVQKGLAECRHSVAPIVSLARFIDELNADPTWTASEVQEVESAVRHILARLIGNGRGPGPDGG